MGVLFGAIIAAPALACGLDVSASFVVDGREQEVLRLPETYFLEDLAHLLQIPLPARGAEVTPAGWEPTLQAEVKDLAAALAGRGAVEGLVQPDRPLIFHLLLGPAVARRTWSVEEFLADYIALRRDMKRAFHGHEEDTRFSKEDWISRPSGYAGGPSLQAGHYEPDTQVVAQLPEEFRLYLEGANAYHSRRYPRAIAAWNALLALPAAERQYRSTWAEFMLGKVYLETDPAAALAHFEDTRVLAAEGFQDTLALASSSIGWQALAECRLGHYGKAARHYLEQIQVGDQQQQLTATLSLQYVAEKVLDDETIPQQQLNDPVIQAIVAARLTSESSYRDRSQRWVAHLEAQGITPQPEAAGHLAWAAYQAGAIDTARGWVAYAQGPCPYATWVQAKLALYDGKLEDAERFLQQAKQEWPAQTDTRFIEGSADFWLTAKERLNSELGAVRLARGEFVPALESYVEGGVHGDMTYVADEVLTVEELASFLANSTLEQLGPVDPSYERTTRVWLEHVLAKRYVRLNQRDQAIEILAPEDGEVARQYWNDLDAAEDATILPEARAQAFISAGKRLYADGRKFFGATADARSCVFPQRIGIETAPCGGYRGVAEYPPPLPFPPPHDVLKATQEEIDRVAAHHVVPLVRDHYEFIAAEHMRQAAQLLPDNHPLLAQALYHGGMYIQKRDPQTADPFYKALVMRCWGLPISAVADAKRWFPEQDEFDRLMTGVTMPTPPAEASPLGAWLYTEFGPGLYRKGKRIQQGIQVWPEGHR
ncbi:MAG: hypothetical protein IT368_17540 [Candidatus Hydrogenedentes bacterium]|nr:hypothetical protein [Candidatus Hydrogenedentota bacterium]